MAKISGDELNPIKPTEESQELLGKYAASDAKHDFSTAFISIFSAKEEPFKEIGTMGTIPGDYFDEWGSLYNIFDEDTQNILFPKNSANDKRKIDQRFKETVLSEAFDNTTELVLNPAIKAHHTYSVRANLFESSKLTGDTFKMSANDLIDFLGGPKVYVQQDAANVSFGDFFLNTTHNPGPNTGKEFIYLNSREGQNDAAGKTKKDSAVVKKTSEKNVKVDVLDDTNLDDKIYSKFEIDKDDSDVFQNFQSKYNLSLSSIKTEKNVQMVALNFFLKDRISATQKGKAENAKGNLVSRLIGFFSKYKSKNTTQSDKDSYFTALQQKRSGDWLQVLSTYDIKRYNLPELEGKRIILITHDLICASYAIAMGIDVILTVVHNRGKLLKNDEKWIVFFQNRVYTVQETRDDKFKRFNQIRSRFLASIKIKEEDIEEYKNQRKTLFSEEPVDPSNPSLVYKLKKNALESEFKLNTAKTVQDFHNKTKDFIKDLLFAFFKYALAHSIVPIETFFSVPYASLINKKNDLELILNTWENDETNITPEDRTILSKYEEVINSLSNLDNSFKIFRTGDIEVVSVSTLLQKRFLTKSKDIQELNNFLDSFTPFSVQDLKTPETSKLFLNRFRFDTKENKQSKNDYGVFAMYLNKLDNDSKLQLLEKIRSVVDTFDLQSQDVRLSQYRNLIEKLKPLRIQLQLFLDEIQCYFSGSQTNPPTYEAGTAGELLNEINKIQETLTDEDIAKIMVEFSKGPAVGGNGDLDSKRRKLAARFKSAANQKEKGISQQEKRESWNNRIITLAEELYQNKASKEIKAILKRTEDRSENSKRVLVADIANVLIPDTEDEGEGEGAAASAVVPAEAGLALPPVVEPLSAVSESLALTTPFTNYLIWLLEKRKAHIEKTLEDIDSFTRMGRQAIPAVLGLGGFMARSYIAMLLQFGGVPPHISDLIVYFLSVVGTSITSIGTTIDLRTYFTAMVNELRQIELTTDNFELLTNDFFIKKLIKYDDELKRKIQKDALERRGFAAVGGGPFDTIDLPYPGWSSLFFHMDTLRTQLSDIGDPSMSFDYSAFARYSQFLIAIEKSIDSMIQFFTIKRPKKGGNGSTVLVLTDEATQKMRPVHLVLHLQGRPVTLYEISIGHCGLFTIFGEYCDLLLTNLLPRIFIEGIWDETKPMLLKSFFGAESESDTKQISLIAELCNDMYLNTSAEKSTDSFFNTNDNFLRYFLVSSCHALEQTPVAEATYEAKKALEKDLNDSIDRLIQKINLIEKNMLLYMYRRKSRNDSITFEDINDIEFLIKNNLINEKPRMNSSTNLASQSAGKVKLLKKRSYGKTKKYGRKLRLKSRRKT